MSRKTIFFIVVGILFLVLVSGFFKYRPDKTIIDKIIQDRITEINQQKDTEINSLKSQMELINNQLVVSQRKYDLLKKKLGGLEQQASNIHQPGSINETKERFKSLGYNPK